MRDAWKHQLNGKKKSKDMILLAKIMSKRQGGWKHYLREVNELKATYMELRRKPYLRKKKKAWSMNAGYTNKISTEANHRERERGGEVAPVAELHRIERGNLRLRSETGHRTRAGDLDAATEFDFQFGQPMESELGEAETAMAERETGRE